MSEIILKDGERIDDLQRKGYRIIQDPSFFCFGSDAVLLSGFAKLNPRDRVLDLGTGGGFPGIPLAFEYPEAAFTLCDSVGKKLKVARAVADGMGLKNVECVNSRVEDLTQSFDWVVTRAVASLDKLYPWVAGRFRRSILCLKGGDVLAEIAELGRKCGVAPGRVRVWSIEDWLKDEYFKEKFVIEIGKDYLCPPKSE